MAIGVLRSSEIDAVQHKIELILDVESRLPTIVQCDPILLRRVLANLVAVSQRFAHDGRVVLSLSWDPSKGRLQGRVVGFRGSRGSDTDESRTLGTGPSLGLHVCDLLVTAMRGRFTAVEGTDHGPGFYFEVPAPVAKNVCDWSSLTAVVVDQDPVRNQATSSMLRYAGVVVVSSSCVRQESPPDLVLVSSSDADWESQCTLWKDCGKVVVLVPNHHPFPIESQPTLLSPIDIADLRRILRGISEFPTSVTCSSLGFLDMDDTVAEMGRALRSQSSEHLAAGDPAVIDKRLLLVEDNKINHLLFLRHDIF